MPPGCYGLESACWSSQSILHFQNTPSRVDVDRFRAILAAHRSVLPLGWERSRVPVRKARTETHVSLDGYGGCRGMCYPRYDKRRVIRCNASSTLPRDAVRVNCHCKGRMFDQPHAPFQPGHPNVLIPIPGGVPRVSIARGRNLCKRRVDTVQSPCLASD